MSAAWFCILIVVKSQSVKLLFSITKRDGSVFVLQPKRSLKSISVDILVLLND